jgi:hypothetical protein
MSRLKELQEEFRSVFSGKGARIFDSLFPPFVFLVANPLVGVNYALWGALGTAGLFAIYRIVQKNKMVYSLGGLGGTLLAAVFVKISGSETGFFLPGFVSTAITIVLCIVSVALNRPLVAWSSFIARRWPLEWYWHPQVLPAYNEVTGMWAVAFSARLILEYWLLQRNALSALGAVKVFLGWPYTIMLLVVSYLYGLWRLGKLKGPGTEEFKTGKPPPWDGQKRGF